MPETTTAIKARSSSRRVAGLFQARGLLLDVAPHEDELHPPTPAVMEGGGEGGGGVSAVLQAAELAVGFQLGPCMQFNTRRPTRQKLMRASQRLSEYYINNNIGNTGNYGKNGNVGNYGKNGNVGNYGKNGNVGNYGKNDNYSNTGNIGNTRNIGNTSNYGKNGNTGNYGKNGNTGNVGNYGKNDNYSNTGNIGNTRNIGIPAPEAYASTYQVAHCGASPWGASRNLQEFPPQRLVPSPREGNFEVCSDNSRSPSFIGYQSQNPRRRWDRRCHFSRPHHDRDVDAFVSSLRKYPSAERSPSSVLLEKLMKSIPCKDPKLAEACSKSLRSLGNKHKSTKGSSSQQTVKRSKRENSRSPNKPPTHKVQFDIRPCHDKYPVKETDSTTGFDYLNSGQSQPCTADVRAGPSEPRALRDALREIYRDERGPLSAFPLCPTMQSRYERHKKECHPSGSQVPRVDFPKMKTCSRCLKSLPCPCETAKLLRHAVDKAGEERRKFELAILSWLKDMPVYPNEHPQDKFIRDAIVKKLAETLNDIPDDEFTTKAREAISQALEKLPMWYPKDETERAKFKSNVIDNLLDKLQVIKTDKRLKRATEQFFEQIPFDKIDNMDRMKASDDFVNEINKIAQNKPENDDVYRDMLKIKAFEILDRLPIKTDHNKYEYLNQLSDELADHLIGITPKPLDAERKQKLLEDVSYILDETSDPIRDRNKVEGNLHDIIVDNVSKRMHRDNAESSIKTILKGKLSDTEVEDTTNKLLALADASQGIKRIDPETTEIIKDEISNIVHSFPDIKNKRKVEEILHKAVTDIVTKGMDGDKALTYLKSVLKGKVPENDVEDIAMQILALADQHTPVQPPTIDQETKQGIKEEVSRILDISDSPIKNRGKVEENLRKLVVDIATTGMPKDKAIAHIKKMLKGQVPDDKLDEITEQVLALADATPGIKRIDPEKAQIIKDEISNVLDSVPGIKNKRKVEQSLHKAVTDIITKGMDGDKALTYLKSTLKGKVPENEIEDVAKQILAIADQQRPVQPPTIDQETNQGIKNDISRILDLSGSPIKNRGKVEENLRKLVADIATTDMPKDKAIARVKSMLKGKVPDDKLNEMTDQILALGDQTKKQIKENTHKGTAVKNRCKKECKKQLNSRNLAADRATTGIDEDKATAHITTKVRGKASDGSKLHKTIKEEISDILDESNGNIKNRVKVEEGLRNVLNELECACCLDPNKARDRIHSILKGNVSDSDVAEISRKILALALEMSFSDDDDGPSASSTKNAEKIFFDQVYEVIREWLSAHVSGLDKNKLNEVAKTLANDTVDRQKYLQLNSSVKTSPAKELEILKEQVYKALNPLVDKKEVQSVMRDVEGLMRALRQMPAPQLLPGSGIVQNSTEFVQENLEGALLDWLRGSPVYQDTNKTNRLNQEQEMTQLAAALAGILSSGKDSSDAILLNEIKKHLEAMTLEPKFKTKDYIRKLADHNLDYLKGLQLFQDISARLNMGDSQRTSSFMPSTNQLNQIVKNWCDALPLQDRDASSQIKQDLANKIILKIGELNMNQDIFNDDLLYEEMLQDFIDQELNALQIDLDVSQTVKDLISQIKEIKQIVQDTMAGRAYRQKLRATISNTLPSISCPTEDELASFELLKENLADAFINLNYSVDDEAARTKFRRRICNEINRFANEYLGRCPATPVDTRILQKDLHNALNNVPVPPDESMRNEVETVRMKDLINDWLRMLPLGRQTKAEQLRTNKMVTLLAQKLQELESEFNPEFNEIATEEIVKYLKKLPLRNKNNLDVMAKKLIDKIIGTAESRSFIAGASSVCASECSVFRDPCSTDISESPSCRYPDIIPPCGLSDEDKKKLQQIRERAQPCAAAEALAKPCCRDAAISPLPPDHGSQTEMQQRPSKSCQATKFQPLYPNARRTSFNLNRPSASTGSQANMSTRTPVNEYYWDSTPDNMDFEYEAPVHQPRHCVPSMPQSCMDPCFTPRAARLRSCREAPICREGPIFLETPSCRRIPTPRRQVASICPRQYYPKPHNCVRTPPRHRHNNPSCRNRRHSGQMCNKDPKVSCPRCDAVPCPYPSCYYFK